MGHRAYYWANKEKYVAYREANKEMIRAHHADYYQENREEILVRAVRYRENHKPEHNASCAERRALKRGTLIGATVMQLTEIKEIYRRAKEGEKVRCYLCGRLIPKGCRHVDHIVPLSRGGKHTASNLAIACDKCNLSKSAKTPQEIGLLL